MNKNSTSRTKLILIIANVVLLIGLAGATAYLYIDNQNLKDELALPEQERKDLQNQKLLAEISEIFDLPEGEEPTIVFVNDSERAVQENPGLAEVFDNLQQGDYILIYRKARLAIHYRPSENKVIKSTEVNLPIAVEVIGSERAIESIDPRLESFGNQIVVTRTVKDGVTQGFVFDVDGDQTEETTALAEQLNLDVGTTLPAGIEPDPQAEIVVVVANSSSSAPAPQQEETSEQQP